MVTKMSTVPAPAGGEVTEQLVTAEQLTAVAAVAPNVAVVAVVPVTKPVPVTVTTVPPPRGPAVGVTAVTLGTAS